MSMTVGQLKEALAGLPDDKVVILSEDAEGNGFSPLAEVEAEAWYLAYDTRSGEQGSPDSDGSVPAVFLWPVN